MLSDQLMAVLPMPEAEPHPNAEAIDGLRALADFLEDHPVPLPGGLTLNLFAQSKEHLANVIRACGGKFEKRVTGEYFYLTHDFGGGITLDMNIAREQVCERVKVGEKVVPAQPSKIIEAQPEKVEEVYEWRCPDSILR